jgi:predicted phage terminase large subunit-like protein
MTTLPPRTPSPISPHDYAAMMRNDLVAFIHRAFCDLNPQTLFLPAPYIELMASRLEDCRLGRIRRLIINLPPRSLKSHCSSIAFVAWLLGHNPAIQIIAASYGQDLADKLARDTRSLMEADWYRALFPTRLSGRKAVNDFTTTAGGTRMATSVGGVLTGRGADVIIIDDPLKPDQALSEVGRKSVNEWYDNTLLSRLNSKRSGCIIIIMQRLHQDDLVGHVLLQDDWTVLSFPAIAEEPERVPFHTPYKLRHFVRQPGEALHPDRESIQDYEAMRRRIGVYNFSSQYQQRPIPVSGNLIRREWLRFYDPDHARLQKWRIVQSWDTASKTSELNDYSACTTWSLENDKFYLIDVFRQRLNYPDLKRAIISHASEYGSPSVVIEDKSSGTQLIQDLRNEGILDVVEYKPPAGADKIVRLHACSDRFENGRVLLPARALWLDDYITELIGFPGVKHDDQVDSTTQALDYLREPDIAAEYLKAYSGENLLRFLGRYRPQVRAHR